jgi:hypothetical protein
VVVVFGSNPTPAVDGFDAEVRTLVESLIDRGAERVVWVPPVGVGTTFDYTDKARLLREVTDGYDQVEVIGWDREVQDHPELVSGDRLHLTPEGYLELAAAIKVAVDQAAGDPGG